MTPDLLNPRAGVMLAAGEVCRGGADEVEGGLTDRPNFGEFTEDRPARHELRELPGPLGAHDPVEPGLPDVGLKELVGVGPGDKVLSGGDACPAIFARPRSGCPR